MQRLRTSDKFFASLTLAVKIIAFQFNSPEREFTINPKAWCERNDTMTATEVFLLAMVSIYCLPYLIWRLAKTDFYAPLVVVQIIIGIILGPGIFGQYFPEAQQFLFSPSILTMLSGLASWAVMLFVMLAGIELDLKQAWLHRQETSLTAGLALGMPLLSGSLAALLLSGSAAWVGERAQNWQFVLGIGMSCAVTALPILILLMEKLQILRSELGQRILRYASLDDLAIWAILALILMDWQRVGKQAIFLAGFALLTFLFRRLMHRLAEADRWYLALIWLAAISFAADWAGLHYMVGAFLAGVVMDADWFSQQKLDNLRHHVLLCLMPVFFLSTGLRTNWQTGGLMVFAVAALLLVAAVAGKHLGVQCAGYLLGWSKQEASTIAWLLQTKALIMIIFANVLLDKAIITPACFTALLLMAVASTMLTVPMLQRQRQAQAVLKLDADRA